MERKIVKGISLKNAMNEYVKTTGVVSEDGKFVVGAVARMNRTPVWKKKVNEETGNETRSRVPARVDINISLWSDEGEQGTVIMPYLSGRVIEIEGGFGSMQRFGTSFDNGNDRLQYKNTLINEDLFETINIAMGLAVDECIEAAEKGEVTLVAGNKYLTDPKRLSKLTDVLMQKASVEQAKKDASKPKAGEGVSTSDKVKNILFPEQKAQEEQSQQQHA